MIGIRNENKAILIAYLQIFKQFVFLLPFADLLIFTILLIKVVRFRGHRSNDYQKKRSNVF